MKDNKIIYSNDLENWNVKQGVSERSVYEVREYANTPQFYETNSSKQKSIQGHLNFSFIAKKMSFLAQGFARVDQWLSFLATAESMIFKPMSSLRKQVSIILNDLSGYFSWIPAVAQMTSFLSWRNSIICLFILLLSNISIANEALPTKKIVWPFDGVFATVDKKAVQRGFQVYKEVCSSCHGLYNLYYRNLKELGFSDEEIKEIAKNYTVQDGPNDAGEMFERPALPSDPFVRPYPNEQAARAANNGADPPDLSLIIKARPDGANYLYSILTGYSDPPENFKLMPGLNYNPYFPHSQIAMPAPLSDGQVKYIDGTNSSVEQMAMDVTIFLQWAAEPEMENRKSMGLKVTMFLVIFIIFFYISKNRTWKNLEIEEYK